MIKPHAPIIVNDLTVIPPPCMTPEIAQWTYGDAFRRIVQYAEHSRIAGDVLEFGTYHGYTARVLASLMAEYKSDKRLWMYDSWEGFPEMAGGDADCPEVTDHKTWKQGDCNPVLAHAPTLIEGALNAILPGRVKCVKGFYSADMVLPPKAAVVHIDCDLYESTMTVFGAIRRAIGQGTVIMFDDWNNNLASNEYGERRAAKDFFPYMCEDGSILTLEPWFSYGSSGMAFILQKS